VRRWTLLTCLLAVLLFASADCQRQSNLLGDMVQLNRSLVPAILMTGDDWPVGSKTFDRDERMNQAKGAMMEFTLHWARFSRRYGHYLPSDQHWLDGLKDLDARASAANQLFSSGAPISQVHEQLIGIRTVLAQLRRQEGISFYPDYLVDFGDSIDVLASEVSRGVSPSEIRSGLDGAKSSWQAVRQAAFDGKLFGFDARKKAELDTCVSAEADALAGLDQALASGDKTRISAAASQMQATFLNLYALFGDFQEVKGG